MTHRRTFGAAGLATLGAVLGGLALQRRSDDRHVEQICRRLEETQPSARVFAPDELPDLPDPARLFLIHAIQPGTVLALESTPPTGGQHSLWRELLATPFRDDCGGKGMTTKNAD